MCMHENKLRTYLWVLETKWGQQSPNVEHIQTFCMHSFKPSFTYVQVSAWKPLFPRGETIEMKGLEKKIIGAIVETMKD